MQLRRGERRDDIDLVRCVLEGVLPAFHDLHAGADRKAGEKDREKSRHREAEPRLGALEPTEGGIADGAGDSQNRARARRLTYGVCTRMHQAPPGPLTVFSGRRAASPRIETNRISGR
jgi:hypothetical protein